MRFLPSRRPPHHFGLVLALVLVSLLPARSARAFTSIEGTAAGDQGFYWFFPSEVWIFAHRLGNIDNRMALQLGGVGAFHNVVPAQLAEGGGLALEIMPALNVGVWVSRYTAPTNGFVNTAVNAIDNWGDGDYGPTDELQANDPRLGDPAVAPVRKVDLFASYWLEDLALETGGHLWFGSDHNSFKDDDSTGPIDIDVDSDAATTADAQAQSVAEGVYKHSDLGIGIGAGYRGIESLRIDGGFEFNKLGIAWEPNGIDNYVDAGGSALAFNTRAHYELDPMWTVGGFLRLSKGSAHLQPKRQRDGGDLPPIDDTVDPTLPTPDITDQPLPLPGSYPATGEPTPVRGIKAEQGQSHVQVAGLVRLRPNSRVRLYSAVGFNRTAASQKLSVGSKWYAETNTSSTAMPFINMGLEGNLFSWMDLMMGATKRWTANKTVTETYDSRIPSNDDFGANPPPGPLGNENNTNKNRRRFTTEASRGEAPTTLTVGTRLRHGPFQLVGHVNLNFLLNGSYILSGAASPVWGWLALVWDWDHDADAAGGNGTVFPEVASVTPAAVVAPAPAPVAPAGDSGYVAPSYAPAPSATPATTDEYKSPYGTPATTP